MDDSGHHIRQAGEYARPAGLLDLSRYLRLPTGVAKVWHDIVKACNRAGMAVVTEGSVRRDGWTSEDGRWSADVALQINTGQFPDIVPLAIACGLRDQHDAVLASIQPSLREEMVESSWDGLDDPAALALRRRKDNAPALTWLEPDGRRPSQCVPHWHISFLRQEVIDRRDRAARLREVKRLMRREVKRRAEWERKQKVREQAIRRMAQSQALGRADIGLTTGRGGCRRS